MSKKLNLQIPKNLNEAELLITIEQAAKPHIKRYCFLGHTEEDMMQLAIMYGIDASHRWDGKRSLKNFLSVHIKNRLYNYKRKHYMRMETPCKKCPLKAYIKPDKCKLYQDRLECELFRVWYEKNQERQNINNAIGFDVISDINEESMMIDFDFGLDIDKIELMQFIDENLDIEFRQDYLTFVKGGKLSNSKLEALITHIKEIVCQLKKQAP